MDGVRSDEKKICVRSDSTVIATEDLLAASLVVYTHTRAKPKPFREYIRRLSNRRAGGQLKGNFILCENEQIKNK